MIKCEVVFDGDFIRIGEYKIIFSYRGESYRVYKAETHIDYFMEIEQAIKYCLEN